MSYEIKSTPFFRRMVSASKKNGQLQRLKEEYERIKAFNDRTIEIKMRQIRLKRLFREIEEIKESSSQCKQRRVAPDRLKTNEEMRMETLVKAKALGKEYSKMNALADRCTSRLYTMGSGAAVECMPSRIELERKARSDKRISYGNDCSRMNIQKIATAHRKPAGKQVLAGEKRLNALKEKLKTRLSFGNSCSHRNLAKKVKKESHKKTTDAASISLLTNSQIAHMLERDSQCQFACAAESNELPIMSFTDSAQRRKSIADICTSSSSRTIANQPDGTAKSEEDPHVRARRHWRRLALIARHRLDTLGRCYMQPSIENTEEEDSEEYTLRGISNDTDLPISQLCGKLAPPDSESDLSLGELLLSVESLAPLEMQPLPDPTTICTGARTTDEGTNQMDTRRKVQQYVKIGKPIVHAAQKEASELGFEKIRSIFEHQTAAAVEAHEMGTEK
ncbi:PREDICTED: uncharacterized protein LOC108365459 isoform X1 [Rhagoletis zephyria]|uniref:uncharacterized protein LOC108365459 isoform X1 n=1 Tax=Rhagoletis zephyria TaxID=28612 RepID=UPI0008112569|nr:PREDICTED: uncharacterized protein LOC108365459 isoform X1 [Rhagoletis zephyria]